MTALAIPAPVHHRYADVNGVRVFYREAGPVGAPVLLLLHGFPSGSHQYRRLIDALAGRYHVIAPDYPGFGFTQAPDEYVYTFDALAGTIDGFVETLGLHRFALYMFDFGGPVGMRLALRHPERITGIVVQNANAYVEGLSELARHMIANRPGVPGAEDRVREILTSPVTRGQYEGGTADTTLVDPSGWTLDQHFLDSPGRDRAQIALALDYHSNVAAYPQWQQWLREHRPPSLILWGRNDAFFPEAGAHAYLADLPDAAVHVFDTGHFALEEKLPEVVPLIDGFLRTLPRKIAVIGAGGRLGSAIAHEATERGHQVTPLGRTGRYLTEARDTPLTDAAGESRISIPDFAAAIVDTIEQGSFDRRRFTVAYA